MNYLPSDEISKIRGQIDHPVIDGDGHLIEYTPLIRDFLVEDAGEEIAKSFDMMHGGSELARQVPLDAKRGLGMSRFAWWGVPTTNTLDRATAMMPKLMYNRMDELGLDFAMLYPTYGLTVTALPDDELRPALAPNVMANTETASNPSRQSPASLRMKRWRSWNMRWSSSGSRLQCSLA
jgi:hypothetical protein